MKKFFGNLFVREQRPRQEAKPAPPVRWESPRQETADFYKKGDLISGKYEIRGTLGKGGFGVVYLAYCRDEREVCALKTFRDELLPDAAAREAFKKEALLWVNLEEHPFILAARWAEEFSGRLFVQTDYVAPDDMGRVSLADHLARADGPLDADQALKWAVQFCLGMEHAQAHGITCHRDIKPSNILITQDRTLKISDFGLAAAAEVTWLRTGGRGGSLVTGGPEGGFSLSVMQTGRKARCGTPGYMAPEVYRGEGVGIASDLYSFGLVLWQMAAGSRVPPFVAPYREDLEGYLRATYDKQMTGRVPRVHGFFGPVIERCLCPMPAERYGSFGELRGALEPILERRTGEKVGVPQVGEKTAAFWNNKGGSLAALGRREEAIRCFEQALATDPRSAEIWSNKGAVLKDLGRHEEAINCFDQALAIGPLSAKAWYNKGAVLDALGRREEAISSYDHALAIDPRLALAWNNKGNALDAVARCEEAINCFDQALAIDPREALTWYNKGGSLAALGRREEAITCYDQALAIDPRFALAWNNKVNALDAIGRREEAISCCDQALAIDPRYAQVWNSKGNLLAALGRHEEAISCYDEALGIDPRYAHAWHNKGAALAALGRGEAVISCFEQALAIDPRYAQAWYSKGTVLIDLGQCAEAINCFDQALAIDPRDVQSWYNKALSEARLGKTVAAVSSYRRFIEIAPPQYAQFVARARHRVLELEAKVT
jgi:tetratricopeptide (TPR) repeat protein